MRHRYVLATLFAIIFTSIIGCSIEYEKAGIKARFNGEKFYVPNDTFAVFYSKQKAADGLGISLAKLNNIKHADINNVFLSLKGLSQGKEYYIAVGEETEKTFVFHFPINVSHNGYCLKVMIDGQYVTINPQEGDSYEVPN